MILPALPGKLLLRTSEGILKYIGCDFKSWLMPVGMFYFLPKLHESILIKLHVRVYGIETSFSACSDRYKCTETAEKFMCTAVQLVKAKCLQH